MAKFIWNLCIPATRKRCQTHTPNDASPIILIPKIIQAEDTARHASRSGRVGGAIWCAKRLLQVKSLKHSRKRRSYERSPKSRQMTNRVTRFPRCLERQPFILSLDYLSHMNTSPYFPCVRKAQSPIETPPILAAAGEVHSASANLPPLTWKPQVFQCRKPQKTQATNIIEHHMSQDWLHLPCAFKAALQQLLHCLTGRHHLEPGFSLAILGVE